MAWHSAVIAKLNASKLFDEVKLVGAKVRAILDDTTFLDIHFDPATSSYSYALIDLKLPYAGDKRVLGWDDYPHEGVPELAALSSHPHHFQYRTPDGAWVFEESLMRGNVEDEVEIVIARVRAFKIDADARSSPSQDARTSKTPTALELSAKRD